MLNRQALELLLDTALNKNGPVFMIYAETITDRLIYTCDFIFNTVLKVEYVTSTNAEVVAKSPHYKINYSARHLPGVAQIMPEALLFETGISQKKPVPFFDQEMIYFYQTPHSENHDLFQFDLFAAVFYFTSRLEEWQNYTKDKHGRFEAQSSLLFQHQFHLRPVLDLWILRFKSWLVGIYKGLPFPEKKMKVISTIDVDNLFAYRHKGFLRTVGASLKDLAAFDTKNLRNRLKVLTGQEKDPFDIYETIPEFCLALQIPLVWFFLVRSGTTFDRTVNPKSKVFKQVFEFLKGKQALIGLHPSYDASVEEGRLAGEHQLISEKLGEVVSISRQHFLRFDIKTTPRLLEKNGIMADFSMGFASSPGFRAGTSHPFCYFDFSEEKKTDFLFVPFCTMDGAYFIYDQIKPEQAFESMFSLALEVKKTGGFFISVFHERTFSNHLYPGFGTLYKNLHQRLKEI